MIALRRPGPTGKAALAAAAISWLAAAAGWAWGYPAFVMAVVVACAAAVTGRIVAAVLIVAAAGSGWAAAGRADETLSARVAEGPVVLTGIVADEPVRRGGAARLVVKPDAVWRGHAWADEVMPPVAASAAVEPGEPPPTAGDRVVVRGILESVPGRVRGDPVAGRVAGAHVEVVASSGNPLFIVGNALRRRVSDRLQDADDRRAALMRGFLVGDTSGLDPADVEDLRRSGLSHFVAVSGSNVAIFLAGWWLATAPLVRRPRMRAVSGLIGLAVFIVVTRWEPSVVRAAGMAGLVLTTRAVGTPIDAWTALGSAVTGLLLLSGDLAISVGFQLSVAATAGVLFGAGAFAGRRPRWLWGALGATIAAQIAVVPLLLVHFGRVPVLSPLANLFAAPLVTAATVLGGVGVVAGVGPVSDAGLVAAGVVLGIARAASGWPQAGPVAVGVLALAGLLSRFRGMRPVLAGAVLAALAVASSPGAPAVVPTVTFLDVGQGDAVLLEDGAGTTALIDGGRDPRLLDAALRRRGVGSIDLVVISHGDADHAGGLVKIVAQREVGEVWVPDQPGLGPLVAEVVAGAEARAIPVRRLRAGPVLDIGGLHIEVLGPIRRYESDNDGSIVLLAEAAGRSVLLPGDIEAVAQRELPALAPDVLLVPHHGSATSDLEWLASTVGDYAVVSVGDNSYGHPAPQVMEVLLGSGAGVWVTERDGDVEVPLG
jgi:competence protein ComEC